MRPFSGGWVLAASAQGRARRRWMETGLCMHVGRRTAAARLRLLSACAKVEKCARKMGSAFFSAAAGSFSLRPQRLSLNSRAEHLSAISIMRRSVLFLLRPIERSKNKRVANEIFWIFDDAVFGRNWFETGGRGAVIEINRIISPADLLILWPRPGRRQLWLPGRNTVANHLESSLVKSEDKNTQDLHDIPLKSLLPLWKDMSSYQKFYNPWTYILAKIFHSKIMVDKLEIS